MTTVILTRLSDIDERELRAAPQDHADRARQAQAGEEERERRQDGRR